jgi:hypothetical protein
LPRALTGRILVAQPMQRSSGVVQKARDADPCRQTSSGQIVLPRHDRLVAQICGLERRTGRSGKDSIDHAPNGYDDLANAVAGAATATRSKYRYDSSLNWVAGPDYGKSEADAA